MYLRAPANDPFYLIAEPSALVTSSLEVSDFEEKSSAP